MAGGFSPTNVNTNFLSYCAPQGATTGQAQLTLETLPLTLALALGLQPNPKPSR